MKSTPRQAFGLLGSLQLAQRRDPQDWWIERGKRATAGRHRRERRALGLLDAPTALKATPKLKDALPTAAKLWASYPTEAQRVNLAE